MILPQGSGPGLDPLASKREVTIIMHATVVPNVELLTDRLLNWYGFVHASDWRVRPLAMIVASTLHAQGVTPDDLAVSQLEAADAETGGNLGLMFRAVHPAYAPGPTAELPAGWPPAV